MLGRLTLRGAYGDVGVPSVGGLDRLVPGGAVGEELPERGSAARIARSSASKSRIAR